MSYIPPTDSVNIINASGTTINPATEESIILLKRIVKLLDSMAVVDSSNRQRVTVENTTVTAAQASAANLLATVSIAAAQTLATLSTITNPVPIGNVATGGGVDYRFEFMELARISYSNGIRSKISIS